MNRSICCRESSALKSVTKAHTATSARPTIHARRSSSVRRGARPIIDRSPTMLRNTTCVACAHGSMNVSQAPRIHPTVRENLDRLGWRARSPEAIRGTDCSQLDFGPLGLLTGTLTIRVTSIGSNATSTKGGWRGVSTSPHDGVLQLWHDANDLVRDKQTAWSARRSA